MYIDIAGPDFNPCKQRDVAVPPNKNKLNMKYQNQNKMSKYYMIHVCPSHARVGPTYMVRTTLEIKEEYFPPKTKKDHTHTHVYEIHCSCLYTSLSLPKYMRRKKKKKKSILEEP